MSRKDAVLPGPEGNGVVEPAGEIRVPRKALD
jgi:hypothetical protein